jgi:hypothetical protein
MVLDQPLHVEWWVSLLIIGVLTALGIAGGSMIFKEKQYLV